MKQHVLVVLATILVQFHIARYADAQSGGTLVPEEFYGSGDDVVINGTIYEEIVERARKVSLEQLLPNDVIAGGSGTSPGAASNGHCGYYLHLVALEYENCSTHYLGLSCSGRCATEERPHHFTRREDATVDPHITTCTCCSMVDFSFARLTLTLDCQDNSTLTVHHITAYATRCGCSACY